MAADKTQAMDALKTENERLTVELTSSLKDSDILINVCYVKWFSDLISFACKSMSDGMIYFMYIYYDIWIKNTIYKQIERMQLVIIL